MRLLIGILLVSIAVSAHARPGETAEECAKRYGKPKRTEKAAKNLAPAERTVTYLKNGLEIQVLFWNGRSVRQTYRYEDDAGIKSEVAWSLLKANGDGWRPVKSDGLREHFQNGDGSLIATYSPRRLVITASDYQAELDKLTGEARKKPVAGL